jgi:Ca2+-transporting ATPase
MKRPPRSSGRRLLSREIILRSLIHGFAAFLAVALVFLSASFAGRAEDETRSLAFLTLVLANSALILSNRSFTNSLHDAVQRRNPTLWIVLGFDALLLSVIFMIPQIRDAFAFGSIGLKDIGIAVGAASLLLVGLPYVNAAVGKRLGEGRASGATLRAA